MLTGEKVRLRPIKKEDLCLFLEWFNDPEVTQFLTVYLPVTELGEEQWIKQRSLDQNEIVLVIEAIEETKEPYQGGLSVFRPIGNCGFRGFNHKDRSVGFGIVIGEKDYWSQGHGTEAARLLINYGFNQLNLHRIESSALSYNIRSLKMHQKIGFKNEGVARQAHFHNGQYYDAIKFGLLRGELI